MRSQERSSWCGSQPPGSGRRRHGLPGGWEPHHELRSWLRMLHQVELTLGFAYQLARDIEAEAGATDAFGAGERPEQPRGDLGRDAGTVVAHRDAHPAPRVVDEAVDVEVPRRLHA